MKKAVALAFGLAVVANMGLAEGLTSSPLPKARPATAPLVATVSTANTVPAAVAVEVAPMLRPRPRPEGLMTAFAALTPAEPQIDEGSVVELAGTIAPSVLRPRARPDDLETAVVRVEPGKPKRKQWSLFKAAAVRTQPGNESILPKKGSVCGDPAIRGEVMAPVVSKVKGCGIAEPVRVTAIAGVKLSQAATVDCATAQAAKQWIEGGMQDAFGKNPVVQLQIAGSYTCRPRNNIRGNKISEHGRGRALDIAGFVLADGSTLSIAGDYRKSKAIKASHKAACGVFGTTLGPGSDGHHEDHLHFDVAAHRNGAYCR